MSDLPEIVTRFVGDARPLIAATAEARAAIKAYAEDAKRYSAEQTATVRQSQQAQAADLKKYQAEQVAVLKQRQAEMAAATKQYTAEQSAATKQFAAEQLAAQRAKDSEAAAELARFQAEEKAATARYNAEQLAATRRYTAEQNALLRARLAEQRRIQRDATAESDVSRAFGKAVGGSPIGAAVGGEGFMALGPAGMAIGATAVSLGAVSVALADISYHSLKMAGDFESATTRLMTSAGETHQNIEMVRKGLVDMAAQVGYSAQDLAQAMYTVDSAQIHGADSLKVLRAAAEGAKTENADLGKVTDAVTTVLTDYHLKADDAAMVTTKLVAATSAGKTTFEELTGALHSVMPIASAAHIPLNDILGDLAAMTIHGYSAEQATQNLSDTIKHMQSPTATQAKELAMLGMTTNQLADDLKSKGLSGTLLEISDRIRKLMPPGTDKVILDMKTALQGLAPAARDLGMHLFDGSMSMKEYIQAAKDLDPVAAKQAQSFATLVGSTHRIGDVQMTGSQVMQNYAQALYKATGDATGLNVALMLTGDNAGTAATAVKTVSDATTEAGNHVKGWSDIQSTLNQQLSQLKAGAEALGIKLGEKLMPTVKEILKDLGDFGGKVKGTFDRPDVKSALDNLNKAFDHMSKDVLKELKKDLDDLAGFIDRNHETISRFINFIANDVMPVLGFLGKFYIGGLVFWIETVITAIHVWQTEFDVLRHFFVGWAKMMTNMWLGYVESLLWGADKAFGWVPGLGPKLDAALKNFHSFRDGVMRDLDSLDGKTVNTYVKTYHLDLSASDIKHGFANKGYAEGGDPPIGQAFWVGERGPELMMIGQPAHVFTSQQSRQIASGSANTFTMSTRSGAARTGGSGGSFGSSGQAIVVHAQIDLDGRKVYEGIIPHAQRHKGRNPNTALV